MAGGSHGEIEVVPFSGRRAEIRLMASIAGPAIIGYLGAVLLGTVDTVLAGRLGPEALAAVALGHMWAMAASVVSYTAARALDPVVSQAHGAKDRLASGMALSRGLVMGFVLTAPVLVLYALAGPALRLLGQPEELIPKSAAYVLLLAPGVPAAMSYFILRQFLQGLGIVRPPVYAILMANVLNFFLDLVLMFGMFGFPAMGINGTAVATVFCQWFLLGMVWFLSRRTIRAYWPGWRGAFDFGAIRRLLAMGLPIGFQFALEVWAFHTAGFLMGRFGATALAAHGVAINLASLSFMIPMGLGAAASTRVGNLVGAELPWRKSAWTAIGLGAAIMTVPATLFAVIPGALARLYTADEAAIGLAVTLLPLAGAFQLFDGTQGVAFAVLRGHGDVLVPALANIVAYWVVGLPVGAWLAFGLAAGPRGIWIGLVAGLVVVAALLLERVRRLRDVVAESGPAA